MAGEYFSIERIKSIKDLKPESKIHVIGVSGVAMAQLAISLSNLGFKVSGSDTAFYEPMGSLLRNSSVKLFETYNAENVSQDCDLCVIGNVIRKDNSEVIESERKSIPITMFPAALYDIAIQNKQSVVVAGTHGKSTTTALGAWILKEAKLNPSWFIGGAVPDLGSGLHISTGAISIVEGDEYDSSFFAKVPKFHFYKPDVLILSSLEFDHADIYSSVEEIATEFEKLIFGLNKGQHLIVCVESEELMKRVEVWRRKASCNFVTYGLSKGDVRVTSRVEKETYQEVNILADGINYTGKLKLPGRFNALNFCSLFAAFGALGINKQDILEHASTFGGVKRRQELRYSNLRVRLIEDFAHHPTAVSETLVSLRERYPDFRIKAVFEPRSNTSRRAVFKNDYLSALKKADEVYLMSVTTRVGDEGVDILNTGELSLLLENEGIPTKSYSEVETLRDEVSSSTQNGDLIVVMSNGAFGGLIDSLIKDFTAKFSA